MQNPLFLILARFLFLSINTGIFLSYDNNKPVNSSSSFRYKGGIMMRPEENLAAPKDIVSSLENTVCCSYGVRKSVSLKVKNFGMLLT